MESRRKHYLMWVIFPLLALAAVFVIRVCVPEPEDQPQAVPSEPPPMVQPEDPTAHLPESPSEPSADTIEVCPSQMFEGYATDTTGGAWATRVTDSTTIIVTCGVDAGTYRLYVVDLNDPMDQPDLYLETCSDMYCTGAYGLVMLEEV